MDANLFSRMVKELLADTGTVVVPGFGTFTAQDVPASFSDRGFTLNPPYRTVKFTLSDDKDDALASFYAKSNNLDLIKSQGVILDYAKSLKDELRSSRTVVLPEFGQLRQAGRNCVVFVPDEGLSIFPQFDLLMPLSLKSRNFAGDTNTEALPEVELDRGGGTEAGKEVGTEILGKGTETEKKGGLSGFWTAVIVIAIVVLIHLVALAVLGRLAPELIDPLLYDKEELEILHTVL